jgi:hypothetical protein
MAITLNKVIGRSSTGKIQYDKAGSKTNPIIRNDGSAVTRVTPTNAEVVRTETIGSKTLQISVKQPERDALGNTALDNRIEENMAAASSSTTSFTPLLIAAALALVLK